MTKTVNFYSYEGQPPERRPWIQIEGGDEVINPHVKIDPAKEILIHFEYPLGVPVTLPFTNEGGFTRGDFLAAVSCGISTNL